MKKRGKQADLDTQMFYIILEIVILMVFYFSLTSYVKSATNDTLLEKNYHARDFAMLINSLYAAPGNVQYPYPADALKNYDMTVDVENSWVLVKEQGHVEIGYTYLEDKLFKNPKSEFSTKGIDKVNFEKTANEIIIKDIKDISLLNCPAVETAGTFSNKRIVIDTVTSGKKDDEKKFLIKKGTETQEISNYKEINEIAKRLEVFLAGASIIVNKNTDLTGEERINFVKSSNADIVLIIESGDDADTSKNIIKTSISGKEAEKSSKMACMMTNNLLSNEKLQPYSLTASAPMPSADLSDLNIAVKIELGNFRSEKGALMLMEYDEVAKSIADALKEYYK